MFFRNIELYVLIFFVYALGGWILESIGGIFNPKVKKFVNRGFLIGPYCPVYGIGVVLVSLLLNKYTNDIPVLFFLSILICGILEYFTGYVMEKLFNARWWDYSQKRFNINGRVCLETLLPFGIAATFIVCKINPFLIENFNKLSDKQAHWITGILSFIFIIDFIISFKIILSFRGEIHKKKDNTEEIVSKVKDKTEEIGDKVKDKAEEVGEIILDKAEDVWMKTESDIRYYGRKYKLKLLRKTRYTRNRIVENVPDSINELARKVSEQKKELESKIKLGKEKLDDQLKLKIAEYEMKQKERVLLTKQVVERFKKESTLRTRLMNAFPNLEIKEKINPPLVKKDSKKSNSK